MIETETENKLGGPRTEEGKRRSSLNSLKHGLFARSILIAGESQEEFDRHLYHYMRDHNPKTHTEEDLVRHLAQTEWRRRRIPFLEAVSLDQSLESGEPDRKLLDTYSIYDQRFNRMIQSTLKTLVDMQTRRKKETALEFRVAVILRNHDKTWNPAADGFVFSPAILDRQINLLERIDVAQKAGRHDVKGAEIDFFIAKDIM